MASRSDAYHAVDDNSPLEHLTMPPSRNGRVIYDSRPYRARGRDGNHSRHHGGDGDYHHREHDRRNDGYHNSHVPRNNERRGGGEGYNGGGRGGGEYNHRRQHGERNDECYYDNRGSRGDRYNNNGQDRIDHSEGGNNYRKGHRRDDYYHYQASGREQCARQPGAQQYTGMPIEPQTNVVRQNNEDVKAPSCPEAPPLSVKNVDTEAFYNMSYEDQFVAQIPYSEEDTARFKRNHFPVEAYKVWSKEGVRPLLPEWKARKDAIATRLVDKVEREQEIKKKNEIKDIFDYQTEIDPNDPVAFADSVMGGHDGLFGAGEATTVIEDETNRVKTYIYALPSCHLLTLGFGSQHKVSCYCPCNRRMKKWRDLACVEIESAECEGKGRFDTPMALVNHMMSMKEKGCLLHSYTLQYLEKVIGDSSATNCKHKGL